MSQKIKKILTNQTFNMLMAENYNRDDLLSVDDVERLVDNIIE